MRVKRTLLLNSTYEPLGFLSEVKVIKLLFKNKVEILDSWDNSPLFINQAIINFPSTLKLNYFVNKRITKVNFARKLVYYRDEYTCQFCSKVMSNKTATIDHLIPKCKGGPSSFLNCVTSCYFCNVKKGNRKLEETELKLLRQPYIPIRYQYYNNDIWYDKWKEYLK